jgi:hypothetical protein
MARDISELPRKTYALLRRHGVEKSQDLLKLTGLLSAPEDLLDDMVVGSIISRWALEDGVSFGPSPEWFAVFDLAGELSVDCRKGLWRMGLTTASPKDVGIEDVVRNITSSKRAKEELRAWGLEHRALFGTSKWDGLSENAARCLVNAGFKSPEHVASFTRNQVSQIRNLIPPLFEEVANWLAAKELDFAEENAWGASLSELGQEVVLQLNIRDKASLQKLHLYRLASVKNCDQAIIEEIRQWARAQAIEIPE